MKRNEQDLDKLITQLAEATRSPRKGYTSAESYKKLDNQLFRRKRSMYIMRIAASAAAAVLICIAGWSVYNQIQPLNMIIESTLAETKTVTLPDGSEVVLNHFTTLKYPEKFKKNREVSLLGEAYFNVTKNKKKPFIVQTDCVNVKVLGTQFNVEAYANDPEIKTTLLEGSVAVYNDFTPQVILKPNESVIYNKEQKILTLNNEENAAGEIEWKDGKLNFLNITLTEMTRQLSNYFGVTIRIVDPELQNLKMTGRFLGKEGLNTILDLLNKLGEFECTRENEKLILIHKK